MAEVGLAKLKLSHKVQNTKKGVKEIPKFRGQSPATKPGAQASRWGRGGGYQGGCSESEVETNTFTVIVYTVHFQHL